MASLHAGVVQPPLQGEELGVKVGVPIAVLVVLLTGIVGVVVVVLVWLTRRHKRKSYEVQFQMELAGMSISNAYISSTLINPFAFLEQYDIEYNYASLEVIGELGDCLLYTSPSPRDATLSRMPSSA